MAKNTEGEAQQGGFFGRIFGNKVFEHIWPLENAHCVIDCVSSTISILSVMTPQNCFGSCNLPLLLGEIVSFQIFCSMKPLFLN